MVKQSPHRSRTKKVPLASTADATDQYSIQTLKLINDLNIQQAELRAMNEELQFAHRELEASRNKYFDLFQQAPIAYFTLGKKNEIEEVNLSGCHLLETKNGALNNTVFTRYLTENSALAFHRGKKKATEQKNTVQLVVSMMTLKGNLLSAEMRISVPETAPEKTHLSVADVTERKKAEEKLAYLSSFPEQSPVPVIEVDLTGEIIYMNPSAKTIFPELAYLGTKHQFFQNLDSLIKDIRSSEPYVINRDIYCDKFWYLQTWKYFPEMRRIRIYSRDITDHKKIEQLKDKLIEMISHEIKTPLTVIIGDLSVSLTEDLPKEVTKDLVNEALQYANKLTDITENLLELSKIQSNRFKLSEISTDIKQITKELVDKFRERDHNHRFIIEIPADLPAVQMDPFRIERVLYNLIENAVKYSPGGGDVKVRCRHDNRALIVSVTDDGIGISGKDQENLFLNFERVNAYEKYSISGLGLGLSVCRALVDAHGGKIWVNSQEGKGSTFSFSIPLQARTEPQTENHKHNYAI